MEVVLYFMLLLAAFGSGMALTWKLGLANKFITHRQLDRTLAEQRVMRNLMDEEIAIISADHQKDLDSFDRQLNPPAEYRELPAPRTVTNFSWVPMPALMAPQTPSAMELANGWINNTERRVTDLEKWQAEYPSRMAFRAQMAEQNRPKEPFWPKPEAPMTNSFVARGLSPGQMVPGHSVNCACDLCLNKRHTPSTLDCGCMACKERVSLRERFDYEAQMMSLQGPTAYFRNAGDPLPPVQDMSGWMRQQRQLQLYPFRQYQTADYCQLCQGECIASPHHRYNPNLSNISKQ